MQDEEKPLLLEASKKDETKFAKLTRTIFETAGVKLAKDGNSVFNYNPERLQSGPFWALLWLYLPRFFNMWWFMQLAFLVFWAHFWKRYISDTRLTEEIKMGRHGGMESGQLMSPENIGILDFFAETYYQQLAGLTRFVLGLYVSLALVKTYYANRKEFGVLFGRTLGFSQMVVAWVHPPEKKHSCDPKKADFAKNLLVRWVNAAFRLLVLEVRGCNATDIGACMIEKGLLKEKEWAHIQEVPSRGTHIYQWINNVLYDLLHAGYIKDTVLLNRMHEQIDDMRAANVWGLPSLPIVYVQIVTTMVKLHLFCLASREGGKLRSCWCIHEAGEPWNMGMLAAIHCQIVLEHFLYQGMLDLHGALYNPNGGVYLGHLPADNFLDFVQKVTTDLVSKNAELPYPKIV